MNTQEIKSGAVVSLVSGGPDMTVMKVEGNEVTTRWFHDRDGFKVDTFNAAHLTVKSPAAADIQSGKKAK